MTDIKPIQTHYNGYLFRSRLEARWAVFFDEMGIRYEYEPEGYELSDSAKYLPDFYLPNIKTFVEVKPSGSIKINSGIVPDISNGIGNASKYKQFAEELVGANYMIAQGDPYDAFGVNPNTNIDQFSRADVFFRAHHIYKKQRDGVDQFDLCRCRVLWFVNKRPFISRAWNEDLVFPYGHTITMAISMGKSEFYCVECGYVELIDGREETNICALNARQARFEHGEDGVQRG